MENQLRGKVFIAIAGNIGAGKTTLTQLLAKQWSWDPYFETVQNNPYLADFYQNMSRWSFPLQVCFLTDRFRLHQTITQSAKSAIQDRTLYEDAHIFTRNLYDQGYMEKREYDTYLNLYRVLSTQVSPPDLIIYLKKSLPKLKHRITSRGREFEKTISDEYLLNLNTYYDDWIDNYQFGKKLVIESDHLDFIHHPTHLQSISEQILDILK